MQLEIRKIKALKLNIAYKKQKKRLTQYEYKSYITKNIFELGKTNTMEMKIREKALNGGVNIETYRASDPK